MIISCTKCKKKFDVDEKLIPKNGRFLQCSSCSHKWFFKKKSYHNNIKEKLAKKEIPKPSTITDIPVTVRDIISDAEKSNKIEKNKSNINFIKVKNNISFFNFLLLSVITLSAILIILDTFKSHINTVYPDFNFVLNNFYETLKDIYFFFKDLIR